ncbi:hypothetical protein [Pedobacter nanyangensis]|uniref:hypothetical protein n=1 Tax=Pedobacter nanyangensis TaxID=1562389 RepID=UPI0013B42689|nr:hypothetical protein [Pedobacter nanyangensis]
MRITDLINDPLFRIPNQRIEKDYLTEIKRNFAEMTSKMLSLDTSSHINRS